MLNKIIKRFVLVGCSTLFFACNQATLYNQYQVIDNTAWTKDKVYYFTFEINDNSIAYDIFLDIRNNNKYPYQNLWLFSNEEPPIGDLKKDTVECILADEFGKWHGHGISLYESSYPIRTKYYFPYLGQYTFSFRQGMRDSVILGIQEIGLRVTPTSPYEMHPNAKK